MPADSSSDLDEYDDFPPDEDNFDDAAEWHEAAAAEVGRRAAGWGAPPPLDPLMCNFEDASVAVCFPGDPRDVVANLDAAYEAVRGQRGAVVLLAPGEAPWLAYSRDVAPGELSRALAMVAGDAPAAQGRLCVVGAVWLTARPVVVTAALALVGALVDAGAPLSGRTVGAAVALGGGPVGGAPVGGMPHIVNAVVEPGPAAAAVFAAEAARTAGGLALVWADGGAVDGAAVVGYPRGVAEADARRAVAAVAAAGDGLGHPQARYVILDY